MPGKSLEKVSSLNFLDEAFRSGFFTHCFLEAGHLSESSPKFRLIRAKDERQKIYDLASLTKPLVTAPLIYRLLRETSPEESARLRVADLRGTDELQDTLRQIRLIDLLSHCSGLPAWLNFWIERLNKDSEFAELLATAQQHQTMVLNRHRFELQGHVDCYSDVGFIILGLALEKYYGLKLHELFQEYLKTLDNISYGDNLGFSTIESWSKQQYITTAYCPVRERWLRGEVHDENSAALGGVSGHAGLFASGQKLSSLLKKSFQSELGQAFWEENERRRRKNQALLGLRPGNDTASSAFANGEAMGHWGFTGTGFWVHVPSQQYVIVLSNRVISSRRSSQTQAFRRQALAYLNRILLQSGMS